MVPEIGHNSTGGKGTSEARELKMKSGTTWMRSGRVFGRKGFIWLCFYILVFVAVAPLSLAAQAQTKFFPMDQLRPGLKGVGYSVFEGTKVEPFDVTVLSTVENNLGKGQLILVKLSGKLLQENGGLSAGMSGSPVYVDKKLLGAISFGFENADPFLALVTPIDAMLKLVSGGSQDFSGLSRNVMKAPPQFVPVATPVMISGMGQRAYEMLHHSFNGYGLKTVLTPAVIAQARKSGDPLKPGSAIAVQMVSGDYQVAAIGTLTWMDKQRFLAFGHPFVNKGEVDYLALQAYILDTIKSPVMSFKLGVPLQPIGRVAQDRQAGIMGYLSEPPQLIPVTVTVTDLDRKLFRTTNFQVIRNEQLYRDLMCSGVTDAIDQTIDRVGGGTAKVTLKIETDALPAPITRENLFCGKDIALASLGDLRNILEILAVIEFKAAAIHSVKVDVEIQNRQATARIIKLETQKQSFRPGETITLQATLHTFRGENLTVPLEVKLPDNLESGKLSLTVRGGNKQGNLEDSDSAKKESFKVDYASVDSLEKLVAKYLNSPTSRQLVLEYPGSVKPAGDSDKAPLTEQLKANLNYYLIGDAQVTIEILSR